MRIAILLPMMWSVRNVVHAGVLHALARADVEAHLLVWRGAARDQGQHREQDGDGKHGEHGVLGKHGERGAHVGQREYGEDGGLFADAAGVHPLLDAPGRAPRGQAFLDAVRTSAFNQHHSHRSHAIYRRWFSRHDGPLLRARGALVEAAGWIAASPRMLAALERGADRLVRRSRDLEPVRRQLRQLDPDLIWSTVSVSGREQPYRLAARDLGVPVVTSVLSFDNLTSRGPLARDDHYLVWGVRMKAQLLRLHPQLEPQQITIAGTPQFDFHRRADCRWPRARTLQALGLSSQDRYFLYGASHAQLTPEEPALVAQVAARMSERAMLAGRALIVRLHPLDDPARWTTVLRAHERVRLSLPFGTSEVIDGWTLPTIDDYARLTSSLAHADGCLNIASTLSLDAAILDRPVICLDFRSEPDSPRDMLYAEYGADHYAPLVESRGLRLAHTWRELLDLMDAAITTPERDRDHRVQMVAEACGPVDGYSAQRTAHALIELARKARGASQASPLPAAGGTREQAAKTRHSEPSPLVTSATGEHTSSRASSPLLASGTRERISARASSPHHACAGSRVRVRGA